MSIVLIRHGETPLNAARVLQPADTPLSDKGLEQAQAVARRLAASRPAPLALLSSDMPRALQTAQAIAASTGLPMRTTQLLHERNFGDLRGRPYDSLGYDPLATDDAPPGGESVAEFEARVAQAFDEILALRAALDGDLVVVTHGLVIRTLLARHALLPEGGIVPASLGNTSVTVLGARAPHFAALVDCTVHLEGEVRDDGRGLSGF